MRIEKITDEYNLKIVKFLLYRSIKDLEKLLECAELIINDGIGSAHLDEITNKKFTDREDDYYLRVCQEVENNSTNVEHLFKALIEWYMVWESDFSNFSDENGLEFYKKNALKTWAHCILTGQPELFIELSDESYQVLTKEDIEKLDLVRKVAKESLASNYNGADIEDELGKQYREEQILIYENKFKEKLKGKKLGVFMEGQWSEADINKLYDEYQLAYVEFESAINQPRGQKDYDYIILCTQRASHGVTYKLKEVYDNHKLSLCSRLNFDQVLYEFKKQLMGYYYE